MRFAPFALCLALIAALLGVPAANAADSANIRTAKALSEAFADVAERVIPAVVSIQSQREIPGSGRLSPGMTPEEFMRRFFENRGAPMPEQRMHGIGSGVIIDAQGHVMTNNHVIDGAVEIEVNLDGGRTYSAKVIGQDPKTDIAVIKLQNVEGDLPIAQLGDSSKIRVGNIVLAIGNPFTLMQTVTSGIISAKNRRIDALAGQQIMYQNFLQTDASINPGNSGGPLVNLDGEVIGINTAIRSGGGGSDGVGFTVPINLAKSVAQQLIDQGRVTRGWLGVGIQDLTGDLADLFPNVSAGVVVREVYPDTPAGQGGMRAGDVIVAFDGKSVSNSAELQQHVAGVTPGTRVRVDVVRKGAKEGLYVTVGTQPDDLSEMGGPSAPQAPVKPESAESDTLGLRVQSLTDEIRRNLGLGEDESGVVVTNVVGGGAAQRSGLQPGAVILEINHQPIADIAAFREAEKGLAGQPRALLLVRMQGMSRFVVMKLQ